MINKAYILPYRERRRLHGRAHRAQKRNHREVCGVLVVGRDRRIKLHFIKNACDEPCHHEFPIEDVRAIQNRIKKENKRILGTFHSHPISEAVPGQRDLQNSFYNGYSMIYDVCGREAKLCRLSKSDKRVEEIPLILESRKCGDGHKG